ncbi:Programmed cell death protein 2 C-terminal domain-containing protein [Phanerochaete sordida]|uniref:Programmed cell death protein 2 C-terminal domain-containing protein n=1 Tax=Phanerochaete sordida TaxID=48140 RepID=A0A9P3LD29_9APHY|nr:Programmed cell death protein 2 C-terminal domain-containing protein [Phanerochaete sordida]
MPPRDEDDWSDDDDDEVHDTVTSVQLGVPDGALDSQADLRDAAVSRIGGLPAFLTSPEPPFESSLCKNCSTPMELVVQVWCPMEDSAHDRALYVWACSRGVCQCLVGSVRAYRGLRFNEKYAVKLEKKKARQVKQAKPVEEEKLQAQKSNPFSLDGGFASAPNPFGLGSQIFSAPESKVAAEVKPGEDAEENGEDDEDGSSSEGGESNSDEELVTAMASSTLESTAWASAPSYPALYMSTMAEYVPPEQKSPFKVEEVAEEVDDGKKGKDSTWAMEGYENSLDIDQVFERFIKRVGYEAEQCIRYELGGTPLPFASDEVFDTLFPKPPAPNMPVTKANTMVVPPAKRTFNPSAIPQCPHCNGKRVFECQLMPNLINILRNKNTSGPAKPQTDEERRKEVEAMLKGESSIEQTGMGWGTCMVFSCEKDCCEENGSSLANCWREEFVLVQWDR